MTEPIKSLETIYRGPTFTPTPTLVIKKHIIRAFPHPSFMCRCNGYVCLLTWCAYPNLCMADRKYPFKSHKELYINPACDELSSLCSPSHPASPVTPATPSPNLINFKFPLHHKTELISRSHGFELSSLLTNSAL